MRLAALSEMVKDWSMYLLAFLTPTRCGYGFALQNQASLPSPLEGEEESCSSIIIGLTLSIFKRCACAVR